MREFIVSQEIQENNEKIEVKDVFHGKIDRKSIESFLMKVMQHEKTTSYDDIVKKDERSENQWDALNESCERNLVNLPDGITSDQFESWLSFRNGMHERGNAECRFYFSVKCECMPDLIAVILEELKNEKSFNSVKMNIGANERLDNLVLYFSENVSKEIVKNLLKRINKFYLEFKNKNGNAFFEYDYENPLGKQVLIGGEKIGMVILNPIRSSRKLIGVGAQFENSQFNMNISSTPNSVLSNIYYLLGKQLKNGGTISEDFLNNLKISFRAEEGEKTCDVADYIMQCHQGIQKII